MEEQQKEKKKVQTISQIYYSRKDIQNAIYKFCKNRETVPRYLDGFGKRPDALDYPSDIVSFAKKGATSFHCSQEIWVNPLNIVTGMSVQEYNKIRKGWDFLIDIDAKFFDYAKIAAQVLIQTLESHGVKNVGIKYSGSKGFHILIPSSAFPEEINGQKTRENFPEWPRAIAGYLKEVTKERVNQRIINLTGKEKLKEGGELVEKFTCSECKNEVKQLEEDLFECTNLKCKYQLYFKKSKRRDHRCPNCKFNMNFIGTFNRYFCEKCKKYKPNKKEMLIIKESLPLKEQNKYNTQKEQTIKSQEDSVDIVLVSPRHLFRSPYSLHEKTALASVVITKDELEGFEMNMANPLNIEVRDYYPECNPGEAKNLLIESLDWAKRREPLKTPNKKYDGKPLDLKGMTITEDMFPDVVKKILVGLKQDGRKRALSILVAFFTSLDFPREYIEEKIDMWNKKNFKPLMAGYIKSQLDWGMRNKRLPPNYDKPVYKELGLSFETHGLKNPINYTIREAMRNGSFSQEKKIDKK